MITEKETRKIKQVTKLVKKKELQRQNVGVTETEAEHMCGGESGLKRALSRGDCRQDADGFFVFRRKIYTDSEMISDASKVVAQQNVDASDVLNMVESMHEAWASTMSHGVH